MAWVTPATAVAGDTLTAAFWNAQVRDQFNAAFPVGSLHWRMQAATAVETTIDGFALEANGVNVTRTTYSALNTKLSGLGYPFGSGNGTTTMTLPDLSGRAPVMMASGGHSNANALGDSDGLAKASRAWFHGHSFSLTYDAVVDQGGAPSGAIGATALELGQAVAGTIGQNNSSDTVPYLVVGVLAVKY